MDRIVRAYLIFGGLFMLAESLIHISGVKLYSVSSIWPKEAITFSSWISVLYSSISLFLSMLLFYVQKDVEKNRGIVRVLSLYALIHGLIISYFSLTSDFDTIFQNLPSLYFWLPNYTGYLLFEAFLLFVFSLLVYLWLRKKS